MNCSECGKSYERPLWYIRHIRKCNAIYAKKHGENMPDYDFYAKIMDHSAMPGKAFAAAFGKMPDSLIQYNKIAAKI